jgi:PhnB protein
MPADKREILTRPATHVLFQAEAAAEVNPLRGTLVLMSKGAVPPAGFNSVTPRMVVSDVAATASFLRAVFGATGEVREGRPTEIRIGDSVVMVSGAGQRELFPAFLYVYVDDADGACRRALDAGAAVLEEPFDTPYGDRRAMVRDPSGNVFQIASRASAGSPASRSVDDET